MEGGGGEKGTNFSKWGKNNFFGGEMFLKNSRRKKNPFLFKPWGA